jgi:hypothetical protein
MPPPESPERTLPGRAVLKRKAAAKREAEAVRLRAEAAEYDRQWAEQKAADAARRQAAENVAATP